jgi:hypothetical protein
MPTSSLIVRPDMPAPGRGLLAPRLPEVMRFKTGSGFSLHSASVVRGWPVLVRAGQLALRRPVHVAGGS